MRKSRWSEDYAGVTGTLYAGVTGQKHTPELQVSLTLYAGVTGQKHTPELQAINSDLNKSSTSKSAF